MKLVEIFFFIPEILLGVFITEDFAQSRFVSVGIASLFWMSLLLIIWLGRKTKTFYLRKRFRLSDLEKFNLFQKRLVKGKSKNNLDKHRYETVFPDIEYFWPCLTLKNINPAIKKQDLEALKEPLERIFQSEIADFRIFETSFLWIFAKKTCVTITFGKIAESFRFENIKNQKPFEIVLGINSISKEKVWDLTSKSTGLVLGTMGSGKSVLLLAICVQLLFKKFKVKIVLATGKDPLEDFPSLASHPDVKLICHQTEDGYSNLISEINQLLKEDKPRMSTLFKEHKVKKWFELPEPELKIIIIDEAFTIASNENWKKDSKLFSDLISLGRSYGHFGIIGTQGQRAEEFKKIGIDPDRFLFKVGSKVSTPQLSQTLYNDQEIGMDDTLTKGKMIYCEGRNPEKIRALFADHITDFPKHSWHSDTLIISKPPDLVFYIKDITTMPLDSSSQNTTANLAPDEHIKTESRVARFKRKNMNDK